MRLLSTAIKMTFVGIVASLIAKSLTLEYWATTGIVGILSISLTKKDTLFSSFRRLIDALFGLMLATLMFLAFGYEFWVFGIFMFIFAYFSLTFKLQEGLVLTLVLVVHLLQHGRFDMYMIGNELLILFIAIGLAIIVNFVYPQSSEKRMIEHIVHIDGLIKDHLFMLSILLRDPEYQDEYHQHFIVLDKKINVTMDQIELYDKDLIFFNDHAYLAYFHMRREQSSYIRHMYQHALKLKYPHPFTHEISGFIKQLSYDIGQFDKATTQLRNLTTLREHYKQTTLPQTREEFELRASLYQLLNEIESFLNVKVNFHHDHPHFGHINHQKASN